MAEQQLAQIVAQLQQQNDMMNQQFQQQLTQQQQSFQQALDMQRAQTQAQIDVLKDLGTAQVARAAQDTKEHHSKAFSKLKPFKGDADAWVDWRYKFLSAASKALKGARAALEWAEDKRDQPISITDVNSEAARQGDAEMLALNMQLHGDLVDLMTEGSEAFQIVRNCSGDVGLEAWRRLNHRYDPANPLRTLQVLRNLLKPSQVGFDTIMQSIEKWEQDMRVCRSRCGGDINALWTMIHMVAIQEMSPKTLRDHLAVQASTIDTPEKQKIAIEKFLQAGVQA